MTGVSILASWHIQSVSLRKSLASSFLWSNFAMDCRLKHPVQSLKHGALSRAICANDYVELSQIDGRLVDSLEVLNGDFPKLHTTPKAATTSYVPKHLRATSGDAFTIVELTRALETIPYKPAILSGANLFGARGVRSRTVMIESRDGTLSLIPFSERGSAYESQIPERREMRAFVCRQFKKQDVLWASEIQSIRDFGSETAVQQVQAEVARKLGRLRNDAEATFEFHLFNGIQGVVKDPKDGATVIDYHAEFGITPAAEVDFDLDNTSPASGALRKRCQALIESVEDSLGGLAAGQVQIRAECGSAFFADLVAHKEVRETYLNTAAAADLRGRVGEEVSFGGITFRRYRGGLGFGVPTDKAYFYPEGVEGLFEIYYAPADTFETVNTVGLPLYARMIPDRDRDEWVRLEIESNPLPICTRPQVLRSARRT